MKTILSGFFDGKGRLDASLNMTGRNAAGGAPSIQLEGSAKETLEQGRNRLFIAGALFAVCFLVLGGRLVGLALSTTGEAESASRDVRAVDMAAVNAVARAPIVDRNGDLMAVSLKTASLYADPREVMAPADAAARLVHVLPDLSHGELVSKLASGRSFIWIKRNLTPRQQYEVNKLGIPGLYFRDEEKRVYPHGQLAAHVLGYTDVDGKGISGVEKYFDASLATPDGAGEPLRLSIDMRVQHALRDELLRSMGVFRAIGAAGLVMDVRTGELLALVSLPDFDPNLPGEVPVEAMFNRATLGVYEMGSTFKTFTTAMALNNGTVKMSDGYDATDPIHIARFRIRDDHAKKRWLSVPEIFMYSSNIGSAKMAVDVGPARHREFLGNLGMFRRPTIELPETGAPLVPARWNTIETMTIAFGHGLSVSPLQLAAGIAPMINGGIQYPPTLVKRAPDRKPEGARVISAATSDKMRRLMRLVVTNGTGSKAAAPGYLVGGKTVTAEKAAAGGYKRNALVTSFVGAFPMNDPRYVVLAMLDEPHGTKETFGYRGAGWTAAPTAGRVIARIAPLLGIAPVDEESAPVQEAMFVKINSREKKLASF